MKKLIAVVSFIVASISLANAEGLKIKAVETNFAVYDHLVRDNGTKRTSGAVAQGSINFSLENDLYINVFGSGPFRGGPNNRQAEEVDGAFGYMGVMGVYNVHARIAHYNLVSVGKINNQDIISVLGEISPHVPWRFNNGMTLNWYGKFELLNSTGRNINNALQLYAGLRNTIPLRKSWTINQAVQIGHQPNFGPTLSSGWIGYYQLNLDYAISKNVTAGFEYRRYQPMFGGLDGGRTNDDVVGFRIKILH